MHNSQSESTDPILFYSEIDENGYEVRKLEIFPDRNFGYADRERKLGDKSTELGDQIVPEIEEINKSPSFHAIEISKEDFENVLAEVATINSWKYFNIKN